MMSDAGPPASMRNLVLQAGHRDILSLDVAGTGFHYIAPFSSLPYLLWPADTNNVSPFEYDRTATEKWLREHHESLGAAGFRIVFHGTARWLDNEVWSYALDREGITLHGAHIDVHWRDGILEGLLCDLPGPVLRFDRGASASASGSITDVSTRVWFPVRRGIGWRDGSDAVLAQVDRQATGPNIRTTCRRPSGELLSTKVSPATPVDRPAPGSFEWTEYNLPAGIFPDQIDSDSQGLIWFSQPLNQTITVFNPESETFDYVSTPGDDPDGMIVDGQDMVWSGLYNDNHGL